MAGQPVKRGNWGDWATIEHTPRSEKRCCGGCIHYCYEDDSCKVRPIVVYEVGSDFWRTCPQYCAKCNYIVKAQYIRYLSEYANSLQQVSPATSMPKTHTQYHQNPSIVVGMDVIDSEHNVGTVLSFDYKKGKIYIKYVSGIVEYQFPDVFIGHQLKKYYKTTGESLAIDYFQKANSRSEAKKTYTSNLSSTQNLSEDSAFHKTEQILKKIAHKAKYFNFASGMLVYSMDRGVGVIDSVLRSQKQISVRFGKELLPFHIPVDFTNGTLALLDNSIPQSIETFLQLRTILLAQRNPIELQIRDFDVGMQIAHIKYGLGKITEIYKDGFIVITFSGKESGAFMYRVPSDFINGRLKVVIK